MQVTHLSKHVRSRRKEWVITKTYLPQGRPLMLSNQKNYRDLYNLFILVMICFFLSSIESWQYFMWHQGYLNALYDYQKDILNGSAPFQADMNRVLGPLIIRYYQYILHTGYDVSYNKFMHVTFFMMNISVAFLCFLYRINMREAVLACVSSASLTVFMFCYWWYLWTNLEFLLFVLSFCAMTIKRPYIKWVTVSFIFILMLINKESSLFFPLWLLINEFFTIKYSVSGSRSIKSLALRCAPFIFMIWLSTKVTRVLRHALWAGLPTAGLKDTAPSFMGNIVELLNYEKGPIRLLNFVKCLRSMFTLATPYPLFDHSGWRHWPDWPSSYVAFMLCVILSVWGGIHYHRQRDAANTAIFATNVSILACIMILSVPTEPDKLMIPIAFFLLFYIRNAQKVDH